MAEDATTTTATATADATTTATTTAATTTAPPVTPSWRDSLPEDIRSAPELAKYQDIAALAKGHLEQSKLVGRKAAVPGPDAKPEEVAAFRKALGVPDAPEGYQIKRPDLAAVLGWDDAAEAQFKAEAHKAGLTPQAAQAVVNFYGRMMQAQHDADRELERSAGLALRREWGANYDANLGMANRFIAQYGGDELVEFLHTSKLGANPMLVKALAAAGADLMEAGHISGEGIASGITAEEADAKIREIDEELAKVDSTSDRARDLVDRKYQYLAAKRR